MPCPLLEAYTPADQIALLEAKRVALPLIRRVIDDYGRLRATIKANCASAKQSENDDE